MIRYLHEDLMGSGQLVTPYFVKYSLQGDQYIKYYKNERTLFNDVSKFYAFDDLIDDTEILQISVNGRKCRYVGWQPDMLIQFKDIKTGQIVFSDQFPQYDH